MTRHLCCLCFARFKVERDGDLLENSILAFCPEHMASIKDPTRRAAEPEPVRDPYVDACAGAALLGKPVRSLASIAPSFAVPTSTAVN